MLFALLRLFGPLLDAFWETFGLSGVALGVVLVSLGLSWALLGAPWGPKGRPKSPKSGTKWRPGSARAPEGLQGAPGTPQELQNGASWGSMFDENG